MHDARMSPSRVIRLTANGESYETRFGIRLPEFLMENGLSIDRVVVERNGEALAPSEARNVLLQDGDRLEIVRIVAGG